MSQQEQQHTKSHEEPLLISQRQSVQEDHHGTTMKGLESQGSKSRDLDGRDLQETHLEDLSANASQRNDKNGQISFSRKIRDKADSSLTWITKQARFSTQKQNLSDGLDWAKDITGIN